MSEEPTRPGFYWAKWKIATEGTVEGDELTPSNKWEVVEVFQNHIDGKTLPEGWPEDSPPPEMWMVSVAGVQRSQAIDGFFWGPGPLEEPRP